MTSAVIDKDLVGARAIRRVRARVLPFFVVLYIIAYIDRANVTFSKLSMTADLKFSEEVFGFGAGIFFIGYLVLEIPGALIMERWSARIWIARILVTWGIVTVLLGFIRTANEFYLLRLLLGFAEAGFFPGLIVYLSRWFPWEERARAMGAFILAVPVSFAVSAPLSALFLKLNWFGLEGWRWMFILEGIPAIVAGFITLRYVTDHPKDAKWMPDDEREWLIRQLDAEKAWKASLGKTSIWQVFRQRNVLILSLLLCAVVMASYGYILWLPTTIQKLFHVDPSVANLLVMPAFLAAMAVVLYSARSSDRKQERRFHTAVPLAVAGVFFALSTVGGQSPLMVLLWLYLTGSMLWGWTPSFWVLPSSTLDASASAAAIGMINSVGNLGGFIGPYLIGFLLTRGYSYSLAAQLMAAGFIVAAALTFALKIASPTQSNAGGSK
jgi:ACS family tartrate transporter-like MFS transporter